MENRNFTKVFGGLEMPAVVKSSLRGLDVKSVRVYKGQALIEVELEGRNIVNEDFLPVFKDSLVNSFDFVNKTQVFVKYDTKEDISSILKKYFKNILCAVREVNRFCYFSLTDSENEVSEDRILFKLKRPGAFLLYNNKIDKVISGLLKERFNLDYRVEFEDGKLQKSDKKEAAAAVEKFYESDAPWEVYRPAAAVSEPKKRMPRISAKIAEIEDEPVPIKGNLNEGETVVFKGRIISTEITETRKKKYIVKTQITDETYSVTVKFFADPEEYEDSYKELVEKSKKKEKYIKVKGVVTDDTFDRETVLMMKEICAAEAPEKTRFDNAEKKRVELHLHTNMSDMDAITPITAYAKRAKEWGHRAIALTDHGVVQAFPEAIDAAKDTGIKILYGCEAYIIDDLGSICENQKGQGFDAEFVVFDLETTGLKKETDKIIEIGAVKVKNGEVTDKFSAFINPGRKLSDKIVKLTGITDDMLEGKPPEEEVVPKFLEFCGDSVLVGHNVGFDIGFIRRFGLEAGIKIENTVLDTLGLARALYGNLKNHKLDTVCDHLGVSLLNHHRAVDDAGATAVIFIIMANELQSKGIDNLNDINVF
ncbi:MAG: PHP domain-containing protein, partial [Clostridiales bacterium]|nr:PHP domain-containing protein [Clostridiales bacterium]